MQAPARFSGALIETLDALSRQGTPSPRRTLSPQGTQGIVLKAPDTSEVNEAVARLAGRGIPVVTLVTLSRSFFRGEEEREMGFRSALRSITPRRRVIDVTETDRA